MSDQSTLNILARHNRKSIRYREWDYRTPGCYFVTACTHLRECHFAATESLGAVAAIWRAIPTYPKSQHTALDEWVIMPNHFHGLLWLTRWPNCAQEHPVRRTGFQNAQSGSVGSIIGTFKSQVTRKINRLRQTPGAPIWQRGYWDRIVRDESELLRIRQYIADNPRRWNEGRCDLDKLLDRMTYHQGP